MQILIATNNSHKIFEIKSVLQNSKLEVLTPKELNIFFDVEETGTTFEENAKLKSEHLYSISKIPSLADDSGLVVEAIPNELGVYSARFGKPEFTDKDRAIHLLEKMKNETNRKAYYHCTISYTDSLGTKFFNASCNGKIEYDYDLTGNGFGYDPIFYSLDLKKRFSQISLEEKNKVSHRSLALKKFLEFIQK